MAKASGIGIRRPCLSKRTTSDAKGPYFDDSPMLRLEGDDFTPFPLADRAIGIEFFHVDRSSFCPKASRPTCEF
jgi:hypothetical protein